MRYRAPLCSGKVHFVKIDHAEKINVRLCIAGVGHSTMHKHTYNVY